MSEEARRLDDDVQRWIDGRLPEASAQALVDALERDPEQRARAEALHAQAEAMRRHFDAQLAEPVPPALLAAAHGEHIPSRDAPSLDGMWRRARAGFARPWALRAAALLAALGVGAAAGWIARGSTPSAAGGAGWIRSAAIAYATYVPEVRHPVEVGSDQEAHLVAWLSKRLGTELRAPQLARHGYRLVGGRLLPADGGPAAMFMYESATGQRLTMYVRRDARSRDTAFRFAQAQNVSSFYWIDHGLGYALSGEIARPQLQAIADDVYRQLNP